MISVAEAHKIIDDQITGVAQERVSVNNTGGRVLAEEVVASFPQPRFDNSAMDGFAVRASDTKGASKNSPIALKMVGVVSAGSASDVMVGTGQCAQCMTGAPIPQGADAIVIVEDSSGYDSCALVQMYTEVQAGQHIRREGEEIRLGDLLIKDGTCITTAEVGTLATFGYKDILVYRKPRLALFATGDELIEPGNDLLPGQIYNSNLYVFEDLVRRAGAEVALKNVIKDDRDSLKTFLADALGTCNMVISSGGVSMGRFDYVRDVFMELNVKEHFWKVAQKPGRPLFFGSNSSTLIFGLPGNPVSAFIGFMEYIWPVLESMTGQSRSNTISAMLDESFPLDAVKTRYLFGNIWSEDGQLICAPSKKIGSHMLTSSLEANCIIIADPGDKPLTKCDQIRVRVLPWKTII